MTLTFVDVSLLALTLFFHWRMRNFFFKKIKNLKCQAGQKKNIDSIQ